LTDEVSGRLTAPVHPSAVFAVLLPVVAVYVAVFVYAMERTTYDVWGALWVAPALIAISVPILLRFARGEPNPRIGRLLVMALVLKLAASIPRYYMVAYLYGYGDSYGYANTAIELRQDFLIGDFSLAPLGVDSRIGTQFVEIITGIVYTVIGPSFIGGFLFFSWISFWGLFFFYRAFRVGIPDGDTTRYALLVFLLPSMLFWPSSIGKEAWMTLALGIATYGSVLLLARRRGASIYLVAGLAGILAVRPHVAALVVAGLGFAYVLRGRSEQRGVPLGRVRTVLGLVAIGTVTFFVIRRVAAFFELEEFNLDTAAQTIEYAEGQSAQGGSEFSGGGLSISNLPINLITVLFRPFPFEVHNIPALLAALEGTVLMLLFVLSWPRLRTIPGRLRKQPYVTFCLTYTLLFCLVFSAFQNFGILARERVMVYPFVLVLLALPFAKADRRPQRRTRISRQAAAGDYAVAATRE
jgi:hypothetical protein